MIHKRYVLGVLIFVALANVIVCHLLLSQRKKLSQRNRAVSVRARPDPKSSFLFPRVCRNTMFRVDSGTRQPAVLWVPVLEVVFCVWSLFSVGFAVHLPRTFLAERPALEEFNDRRKWIARLTGTLRLDWLGWLQISVLAVLVAMLYHRIVISWIEQLWTDPYYSHCFFVPLFSGWVIWRMRDEFRVLPLKFELVGDAH